MPRAFDADLTTLPPWYRDIKTVEWSQELSLPALMCMPAVIASLAVALLIDRPQYGAVAASGAVSVGFAAFHRITRYRVMPLLLVAVGMAASEWIGAVIGGHGLIDRLIVTCIWGLAFGAAAAFGQEHWWLAMQWTIGLCISAAYPAQPWAATQRVSLVLLGASVQGIIIAVVLMIRHQPLSLEVNTPPPIAQGLRWMIHEGLSPRTCGGRFALRMAVLLPGAVFVSHVLADRFGMRSSYWIPMTAAIVFRPHVRLTFTRGCARFGGTVGGALLATAIAAFFRPNTVVLSILLVIVVWAAFAVQRVNYGMFAMGITMYIVFLLAIVGLPEREIAGWRTVATLIGGVLAMIAHFSVPNLHWTTPRSATMPP